MVGGVKEAKVDLWKATEGDWIQDRLKAMEVKIEENTPAVLMRLPGVTECLGLGKEVEMLEATLRDNAKLPALEVHPPVTMHRSRVLNVLAWSGVSPEFYCMRLPAYSRTEPDGWCFHLPHCRRRS